MNRNRVILAALLAVLGLCLLYAYVATPRLEKAPPRAASDRTRSNLKATDDVSSRGATERINFDFMTVNPEEFSGAKRDIFQFGGRPPAVHTAPAPVIAAPVSAPVVAPVVTPVAVAVVNQALSKFTFLGFLEKNAEKTVFLSSGGSLFLVKRGERFGADQEFLVHDISGNLLKVQHAGREGLMEIPLIEQQKLNASVSSPAPVQAGAAEPTRPGSRAFPPQRRLLRPAAPQEIEEALPEINEETTNPEEEQESEEPVEGDVLEGESNGSNQ